MFMLHASAIFKERDIQNFWEGEPYMGDLASYGGGGLDNTLETM